MNHILVPVGKTSSEVTGSIGDLMNLKKYYGSHSGSGGIVSSVPNNSDSMIARVVPLSTVFSKSSTSETPIPSPEALNTKTFKLLNETLPTTHEEDDPGIRDVSRTNPTDFDDSAETDGSEENDNELAQEMEDIFPPIVEEDSSTDEQNIVPAHLAGVLNDRRQVLTSSQRTERLSRLIRQQRSSEHNLLTFQPRPIVSCNFVHFNTIGAGFKMVKVFFLH